ncbi:hypothetical protein [Swingsia samuiensis]|uniref:Uncharacterized protein n=1 Tax=Swingsia samuiensis TaxID=1293412 RepID=A0A4Y6UIB1_9PROT|nr:hypothetical protein [Swingsia samuiensis]QDH16550.1 hypothetical protein E3D00_02385 [Swingsia samuiensis]
MRDDLPSPQPLHTPSITENAKPHRKSWLSIGAIGFTILAAGFHFYNTHTPQTEKSSTEQVTSHKSDALRAVTQLSMILPENAPQALAKSRFSPTQQSMILAALKRGSMRLVEMPVLDAAGLSGQTIDISVAGLTQRITLTGHFQRVILPISEVGQVTITPVTAPHAPVLNIGAMTALGPEVLPSLTSLDQSIVLNILVQ